MQYIINSGFVSLASSINIAILVLMSITAIMPRAWLLNAGTGLLGILFNIYVLLHSKRKLGFLMEALKEFQLSIEVYKQKFIALKLYTESFINTTLKKVVREFLCQLLSMEFSLSSLQTTKTKRCRTSETSMVNKVVKVSTPEATSLVTKPIKAQSDPLSRTKMSIRKKYLPVASPELFKNKIYLTRRNLTNALHD